VLSLFGQQPVAFDGRRLPHPHLLVPRVHVDAQKELGIADAARGRQTHAASADHHPVRIARLTPPGHPIGKSRQQDTPQHVVAGRWK
jgi:hypothetical protein